ncbi:MAG: helix-turn-helix transcriptional regulator [Flavobacteriales bacterium]|jgi:predicted DNA-binding transcriptional regulator YafY
MPANKYALLRYRVIDRCLNDRRQPYPSREYLREACEEALYGLGSARISLSTVDKDIRAMREEEELGYHAPIAFDRENGGYFYTEEGYSISQLALGEEDLEALRFAAAILRQFRDIPMLETYQNAVDKISSRLMISPRPDDDSLGRFIQFEQSTTSGGYEYLGPLLSMIRHQLQCQVVYRSFRDDVEKSYLVYPLLLKEYSNRWYLVAHVPERSGRLTFGLERMLSIRGLEEGFERPADFDPEHFFQHSIGITETKAPPETVVLRCRPVAGRLLKTQPFHSSQEVLEETDAHIRLRFTAIPSPELYARILSFGSGVQVESPPAMAEYIRKEWQEALEQNS